MPILKIRGHEVDVDIVVELESYEWGYGARWTSDKLIASSPFRTDSSPSFFVSLSGEYSGTWADSGAVDDEYQSGGFVKLLAYLRGEYVDDTADYLLEEYGVLYEIAPNEPIRLPTMNLRKQERYTAPDGQLLTQAVSPYLTMRDISKEAQREYNVGYGANYIGFTALPWYTADGRLANVKYRSTRGKTFFYEKGATPVRQLVYGLNVVNESGEDFAVLVEGEIDVLSWASAGVKAIAVGGSSVSREQVDAIKRSGIRRLGLGADNDAAGKRLNKNVVRVLGGYVELYEVDYENHNDANDYLKACGSVGLRELSEKVMSNNPVSSLQIQLVSVK